MVPRQYSAPVVKTYDYEMDVDLRWLHPTSGCYPCDEGAPHLSSVVFKIRKGGVERDSGMHLLVIHAEISRLAPAVVDGERDG
jgi:hypothetical protein